MGYAIPVKVYEQLEQKLGKETASLVVETLEKSIDKAFKESKEELKVVISEELKKELATKYDIMLLKKDIEQLRQEMKTLEIDLRKEIELVRKDMKIMTIIIIAVIILLNQNSLEFIARLLGLLK